MKLWKIVFAIWVFFWVFFVIRGLYKGDFEEYKALLARGPEERRAYVVGEELYKFLEFSLKNLPKESTFQMEGSFKPIDEYRFVYCLYPRMKSDNPEYILCYRVDKDYGQQGFYRSATLKNNQFILKRR